MKIQQHKGNLSISTQYHNYYNSDPITKWNLQVSKDKIAEFLIKTELKKYKNMQNILLKGC